MRYFSCSALYYFILTTACVSKSELKAGRDTQTSVPTPQTGPANANSYVSQPEAKPGLDPQTTVLTPQTALAVTNFSPGQLTAINARTPDQIVYHRPGVYDYAPSIILDGVYRMWWCGGIAGDHILYAEASSLSGPWHARGSAVVNSFNDVFRPTGNPNDFDGTHTCDPSVLRTDDGTYYLYYGGFGSNVNITAVGAAISQDGLSWSRLNGGKPILWPARPELGGYGAGQPSTIYLDQKFYLAYTDMTGLGSHPVNHAGIFILRSADPTFQTGVEEMGQAGFAPMETSNHTAYAPVNSFSIDWVFSDALDGFIIASDNSAHQTNIWVYDRNMQRFGGNNGAFSVAGDWHDGPGIVSRPDRHALPNGTCTDVALDILRATSDGSGSAPNSWDLGHNGIDLRVQNVGCADMPVAAMYDGFRLTAPNQLMGLDLKGKRINLAFPAPSLRVTRNQIEISEEGFLAIPYVGTLDLKAPVIVTPGLPVAYLMADTKVMMPVSCMDLVFDVHSSISYLQAAAYGAYTVGPTWHCLHDQQQ